jgi:hypothetical protein
LNSIGHKLIEIIIEEFNGKVEVNRLTDYLTEELGWELEEIRRAFSWCVDNDSLDVFLEPKIVKN